jgi:hypothetical protein
MNFDALKTQWKSKTDNDCNRDELKLALQRLQTETKKIDRSVMIRDVLEISASVVLLLISCFGILNASSVIQSIGFGIWIFTCILVPYKLVKAKINPDIKSDCMKAYLNNEKIKLHKQKRNLETVAWWYILPCLLGIIFVSSGTHVNANGFPIIDQSLLIYLIGCIFGAAFLYFLNRHAAEKKFQPLIDKIDDRLSDIEHDDNSH